MGKILIIKGADFSAVAVGKVTPIEGMVDITVLASPTGGGTVTGSGSYAEGTQVQISATAAEGFTFVKWNDGSTSPTRTITVGKSSATYTAEFKSNRIMFNECEAIEPPMYPNENDTVFKAQNGQICHLYPTQIKAGQTVKFTTLQDHVARIAFCSNNAPQPGDTYLKMLYKTGGMLTVEMVAEQDCYMVICVNTFETSKFFWDDMKDVDYFTID